MRTNIRFDDKTTQRLFGHEAAEDEDPDRLRTYYFRGGIFERATADMPLRILVGHKGLGKSALFQVAKHQDADNATLAILLRPDDVHEVETVSNMLAAIRSWKEGLLRIIHKECLNMIGKGKEEERYSGTDMTATHSLSVSIQHLNRTLQTSDLADVPDVELVGRFVERRDEAAFAALVRRHGPVVLAACRRVLRHEQDAEDAFQATFLVFAREAASIRRAKGIRNWLYGVALNVARKAKTARHRRAAKESEAALQHPSTVQKANTDDLREVLDLEINSLPAKYRVAIVLCDLMGLTTQQASTETGCPPKTLGTRLARGRTLLARRLSRHSLSLPAAGLAAVLVPCAEAAVPPRLLDSTIRAAADVTANSSVTVPLAVASLTERVSKIMVFKNLKIATTLTISVLFVGGLAKHGGFAVHATPVSSRDAGRSGDPPVRQTARHATFADHLDHLRRLIDHLGDMLGQVGFGKKGAEALAVDAGSDYQKEDKEKPALSGVWVQKDGELKIEFSDKNTMSISPHGENKVIVILCEYTLDKEGLVKAKVTGFEGTAEAKKMVIEHLPIGTEFSFTWKVKDGTAAINDVKGEKDKIELLKSRLETEYRKK